MHTHLHAHTYAYYECMCYTCVRARARVCVCVMLTVLKEFNVKYVTFGVTRNKVLRSLIKNMSRF